MTLTNASLLAPGSPIQFISIAGNKLMDQIFDLKFTSKQLVRQAKKCEKEEKTEKLKVCCCQALTAMQSAQPDRFPAWQPQLALHWIGSGSFRAEWCPAWRAMCQCFICHGEMP